MELPVIGVVHGSAVGVPFAYLNGTEEKKQSE
jgi:hypothetical protein